MGEQREIGMRRILTVAVAGALLVVGGAAWAAQGEKTTGGVNYTTDGGFAAQASFTAEGDTVDAKGRVNVRFSMEEWSFKGDVECYYQNGNMASFSGHMDTPTIEGDVFRIIVLDAGEPSAEDEIRIQRDFDPNRNLLDCDNPDPLLRPIEDGNLQVHGV